ncbi:MAG: TetR/AcrR family transcriptional regulator [Proteobacteria bacterium]|nr:TetR/AcrR family transcriptional regulator [Pseudomonadota bacterium]
MTNFSRTSDDILACARSLIVAGGYNGFSFADIAEVVGIRKASIHHHFPTKVDLVRKLVVQYREDAEAGIADLERQVSNPREQLGAYLRYWETCISDSSRSFCVCALLATELPVLPQEIAAEIRAYFRFLSGWLTSVMERGAQKGSLGLTDTPRVEAETFMAAVHGAMLSARAYGDPKMFALVTNPHLRRLSR